jgi:uncharacterized Zn finger protein (UPF0148 family)
MFYWHLGYCERCGWALMDEDDDLCCVCQATVEKQEEE